MKFDFNRPRGLLKILTTDNRQHQPCHPVSSPMSLWLRGAKKEKTLKTHLCGRSRSHPGGLAHLKLKCLPNGLQLCFLPGIAKSNVVERHLVNCPTT